MAEKLTRKEVEDIYRRFGHRLIDDGTNRELIERARIADESPTWNPLVQDPGWADPGAMMEDLGSRPAIRSSIPKLRNEEVAAIRDRAAMRVFRLRNRLGVTLEKDLDDRLQRQFWLVEAVERTEPAAEEIEATSQQAGFHALMSMAKAREVPPEAIKALNENPGIAAEVMGLLRNPESEPVTAAGAAWLKDLTLKARQWENAAYLDSGSMPSVDADDATRNRFIRHQLSDTWAKHEVSARRRAVSEARFRGLGLIGDTTLGVLPAPLQEGETDPASLVERLPALRELAFQLPPPPAPSGTPGAEAWHPSPADRLNWALIRASQRDEADVAVSALKSTVPMRIVGDIGGLFGGFFGAIASELKAADEGLGLYLFAKTGKIVDDIQEGKGIGAWNPFSDKAKVENYYLNEYGSALSWAAKAAISPESDRKVPPSVRFRERRLEALREAAKAGLSDEGYQQIRHEILTEAGIAHEQMKWAWPQDPNWYARQSAFSRLWMGVHLGVQTLSEGILGALEGDEHTAAFFVGSGILHGIKVRSVALRSLTTNLLDSAGKYPAAKNLWGVLQRYPKETQGQILRDVAAEVRREIEGVRGTESIERSAKILRNAAAGFEVASDRLLAGDPIRAPDIRPYAAQISRELGPSWLIEADPFTWLADRLTQGQKAPLAKGRKPILGLGDVRARQLGMLQEGLQGGIFGDLAGAPRLFDMGPEVAHRLAEGAIYRGTMADIIRARRISAGMEMGESRGRIQGYEEILKELEAQPQTRGTKQYARAMRKEQTYEQERYAKARAANARLEKLSLDLQDADLLGSSWTPQAAIADLFDPTTFRGLSGKYPQLGGFLDWMKANPKIHPKRVAEALGFPGPAEELGLAVQEARSKMTELAAQQAAGATSYRLPPDAYSNYLRRKFVGDRMMAAIDEAKANQVAIDHRSRVFRTIESDRPTEAFLEAVMKTPGTSLEAKLKLLKGPTWDALPKASQEAIRYAIDDFFGANAEQVGRAISLGVMSPTQAAEGLRNYTPHVMRAWEVLPKEAARHDILRDAALSDVGRFRLQRDLTRWRVISPTEAGLARNRFFADEALMDRWLQDVYGTTERSALETKGIRVVDPLPADGPLIYDMEPSAIASRMRAQIEAGQGLDGLSVLEHLRTIPGMVLSRAEAAELGPGQLFDGKGPGRYLRLSNSDRLGRFQGGAMDVEGLRGMASWGRYSRVLRAVSSEIAEVLDQPIPPGLQIGTPGFLSKAHLVASRWLRFAKIPVNFIVGIRNATFNMGSAMVAGIPPWAIVTRSARRGMKAWLRGEKFIEDLQRHGVDMGETPLNPDTKGFFRSFESWLEEPTRKNRIANMEARLGEISGLLEDSTKKLSNHHRSLLDAQRVRIEQMLTDEGARSMVRASWNVAKGLGRKVYSKAWDLYGAIDPMMKAGYAQYLLDKGVPLEQVAGIIKDHFQQYSHVPPGMRRLSESVGGSLVVGFPYEFARLTTMAAMKRPLSLTLMAAALVQNNMHALAESGMDLRQYGASIGEREGYGITLGLLGDFLYSRGHGRVGKIRLQPWYGTDVLTMPVGILGPAAQRLREDPNPIVKTIGVGLTGLSHLILSNPFTAALTQIGNRDPFTNKRIADPSDTTTEAIWKHLKTIWRSYTPDVTPGGAWWDRTHERVSIWSGRKISKEEAVGRLFGVTSMTPRDGFLKIIQTGMDVTYRDEDADRSAFNRRREVEHLLADFEGEYAPKETLRKLADLFSETKTRNVLDRPIVLQRGEAGIEEEWRRMAAMGPIGAFQNLTLPGRAWALRQFVDAGLDKADPRLFNQMTATLTLGRMVAYMPETAFDDPNMPAALREESVERAEAARQAIKERAVAGESEAIQRAMLGDVSGLRGLAVSEIRSIAALEDAIEVLGDPAGHPALTMWRDLLKVQLAVTQAREGGQFRRARIEAIEGAPQPAR